MDYNSDKKDKHKQSAELLASKLTLENSLAKKISNHFSQVNKQVKTSYENNGKLPSFSNHKKTVKGILKDHYEETAGQTSTTLRDNFQPVKNNNKVQALIDTRINANADDRSDFSSDSIAQTTQDNYKSYIKEAVVAAAVSGVILSKEDIAESISGKFEETSDSRISSIATTETNIASNDGQDQEMTALGDTDAEFEDGTTMSNYEGTKTWVAILDDRTRDAHAEADGQEVGMDEPFSVGGESLMYPGDDNLDASPENLINCRCDMVFSLEEK